MTLSKLSRNGLKGDHTRTISLLLTGVITMILGSSAAWAQSSYDTEHRFTLRPRGNVIPRVTAHYYARAWEQDGCLPQSFDSKPPLLLQPAGYDPFARDFVVPRVGVVDQNGNRVNVESFRVDNVAGFPLTTWCATAGPSASFAEGCSSIQVNPFGIGTGVTGVIRAFGNTRAQLCPPRARAYAFSYAMVEAQGGYRLRNGRISWHPVTRSRVAGRASHSRQVHDPIVARWRDPMTGETREEILFMLTFNTDGDVSMQPVGNDSLLEHQGSNGDIVLLQGGVNEGTINIRMINGVVVHSMATGIFAGVGIPPAGSSSTFTMLMPGGFEIDYRLPGIPGDANDDGAVNDIDLLQTLFDFGQSGQGLPTDFNGDGVVNDEDLLKVLLNFGRDANNPGQDVEIGLEMDGGGEASHEDAGDDSDGDS